MTFADHARWIWAETDPNEAPYNLAILARRGFVLDATGIARIKIAADSWYRLRINGQWIGDGPARGWPRHFYYDEYDVTLRLQAGENTIEILARHFGTGDFHYVPVRPGLLVQLDVELADGTEQTVATDNHWEVAEYPPLIQEAPRIALQMEPMEIVDARLDVGAWSGATIIADVIHAPWQDLRRRDCALSGITPRIFKKPISFQQVAQPDATFLFPVQRLVHRGAIEIDSRIPKASMAATILRVPSDSELRLLPINSFPDQAPQILIDGDPAAESASLAAGDHLLIVFFEAWGHHNLEQGIRIVGAGAWMLINPADESQPQPWIFAALDGSEDDPQERAAIVIDWNLRGVRELRFRQAQAEIRVRANNRERLLEYLSSGFYTLPAGVPRTDPFCEFLERVALRDGGGFVANAPALMHDQSDCTVVTAPSEGAIELAYDLGDQSVGYYEFEVHASAGTVIDVFGVEYLEPHGQLQPTWMNRNGLRYICREGRNHWISLKRRSGRYLFITLRNQTGPVRFRHLRVLESTYPVRGEGAFSCSDAKLDQIWAMSARTLQLCMEDVFTDCPLYEQTHWVGDARNEGLYALNVFGAEDLVRRCLLLAADSLDDFPIVSPTAPTCSRQLLPAWSFLWVLAAWDYHWHTADEDYLRRLWPRLVQNLRGALSLSDERGLFSGPFWNMFDWTPIDCGHNTVTHNSLLLLGALAAAGRSAAALDEADDMAWIAAAHARLRTAVLALWDTQRQGYPDSIHNDGVISPSQSVHNHFLGLLYDTLPLGSETHALSCCLEPPDGMIRVGSPFAMQYWFEALEKAGQPDRILDIIQAEYAAMLRAGSTTVWEQLSSGGFSVGEFPSRSHCHAWSAAPLYFFNRIILGIRQLEPGGTSYEISPWISSLDWARGTTVGHLGNIHVEWERAGKQLVIRCCAPAGVELIYRENPTHAGFQVEWKRQH